MSTKPLAYPSPIKFLLFLVASTWCRLRSFRFLCRTTTLGCSTAAMATPSVSRLSSLLSMMPVRRTKSDELASLSSALCSIFKNPIYFSLCPSSLSRFNGILASTILLDVPFLIRLYRHQGPVFAHQRRRPHRRLECRFVLSPLPSLLFFLLFFFSQSHLHHTIAGFLSTDRLLR